MKRHCLYITLLLSLICGNVFAEKKPTVGLVLSGGGARGIAHVGVIQALEDNGIPIDYIASTSMGSVVGGLYAIGYSPQEMMNMFTSADFHNWSMGVIDRDSLWAIAKPSPSPKWFEVSLDKNMKKKWGVSTDAAPSSLINPLPMNIEFLNIFSPYTSKCKGDFDKLFVPIRTLTSDIYHKRKVVCRNGSLGDAVRASMSFPLVYKPIQLGDTLLMFDGGIYDNFPVNVMHEEFNPDFMIGVSVSLPDGKPLPNDLYSQLSDMIIQTNDYSLPDEYGVKIQVPVKEYNVLEFNKANEIYEIGYQSGLQFVDSIKKRLDRLGGGCYRSKETVAQRRKEFKNSVRPVYFNKMKVDSTTAPIAGLLDYTFMNGRDSIGLPQINDSYYFNISTGKYTDLVPQQTVLADGSNMLVLTPETKGRIRLGLGGFATTTTNSRLFLSAGYYPWTKRTHSFELKTWIGQTYQAGEIAMRFGMPWRYKGYFELSGVLSRQKQLENDVLFYENSVQSFAVTRENYARVSYVWGFHRSWLLKSSLAYGYLRDKFVDDTENTPLEWKRHSWKLGVSVGKNTLDNEMYPMAGTKVNAGVCGEAIKDGAAHKWHPEMKVFAEWNKYYPLGQYFSVGLDASGEGRLGKVWQNSLTEYQLQSPAFSITPATEGYFNKSFRNPSFVAAGISPVFSPLKGAQLRADAFIYEPFSPVESIVGDKVNHGDFFGKPHFMTQISVIYNFGFASLCAYGNYISAPTGNWNFGLSFGILVGQPKF